MASLAHVLCHRQTPIHFNVEWRSKTVEANEFYSLELNHSKQLEVGELCVSAFW